MAQLGSVCWPMFGRARNGAVSFGGADTGFLDRAGKMKVPTWTLDTQSEVALSKSVGAWLERWLRESIDPQDHTLEGST